MATRKRRSTKRRRVHARRHNPVNPVNPTRRRRRSTKRRRSAVYARRRNPVNPTHRRRRRIGRRRHHRNPFGAGGEIFDFAGGAILLGLVQAPVARIVGPYAQALGQFAGPAVTAITGFLLSKGLEMFGPTRRFAKATRILGYSTALVQVVQPIVARTIAGVGGGGNAQGMGRRRYGMNGIVAYPGVPAGVPMMPPAPPNAQGMNGVVAYPGVPAWR